MKKRHYSFQPSKELKIYLRERIVGPP
jgi:hypothetical protein